MAKSGRHPHRALSVLTVKGRLAPGRYTDGNGLYLVVDQSGARRWMLRTVVQGRRRDIGQGGAGLVSLAEARELAISQRRIARNGGDPIAERRKQRSTVPTFEAASQLAHAEHKGAWRNAKHSAQWINTLRDYAFPIIGSRRVDQLETPDILRVLSPIWLSKPETARRLRQRIGSVLDWASASGYRSGENPVRGVIKGLPKQPDRKTHFAAMDYDDIPSFVQNLQWETSISAQALEFLIVTVCRTNEVIGAQWDEIHLDKKLWTIPGNRMKAKAEHRVPLSSRAMEILRTVKSKKQESPYVFPGNNTLAPSCCLTIAPVPMN